MPQRVYRGLLLYPRLFEQIPRSPRRNGLPMKLIDRALLMRHEHLTCTLIELMQITQIPSRANGVFHRPPEAFDGVEMVPTVGW
jgi:hypothetical protein